MPDRAQDMLCKARDMAEKAADYYGRAMEQCSDSLSEEIFALLRDENEEQKERIAEVEEALSAGESWANACTLPPDEDSDVKAVFRALARKHQDAACPISEMDVLIDALEMERTMLAFYETAAEEAENDVEKRFVEQMLHQVRGHHVMLNDLKYYFEDPQGWYRDLEKSGLDGA
jgi:rubrerythrin